ncbi:undecaprenyl-diphosphatase [Methanosarcina sp. MSH10X1]|uniref:undecaprenyl-diphosphatase n=1 Tax=Methanosarcina sp. MSH10X1 TaxID=2507075 RepID=UPI000FFC954D|nr:undecaprenyl-diphosphatase [Methanosarcina sp. MSH10X1]RXA21977.1 undecaprenyl-diphosphatase [Methanosarcina sp. MSH10X1]
MITDPNLTLFHIINGMAGKSPALDSTVIFAAKYVIYIFGAYLAYLWLVKNQHLQEILFTGYAALLGMGINVFITLFYFHPRPFMIPTGTLLIAHASESSFPSDHATIMFSLSLMLLAFKELRRTGVVFLMLSCISGLARVYSGLHFPMDIAGSLLAALLSMGILLALKKYLIPFNRILISYFENIKEKVKKNGLKSS